MLLIVLRVLYAFVCAGAIATIVSPGSEEFARPSFVEEHPLFTFITLLAATQVVTLVDALIPRKRIEVISAIYFGLLVGALLCYLMLVALEPIFNAVFSNPMTADRYMAGAGLLLIPTLTYLTISLLLQTKDDFRFIIPYVEFARELKGGKPLILDSSALIDGRIADIVDTKILDAKIVVPEFILQEVQSIADSNDKNRRTRGRRGLDVLQKLQTTPHIDVEMYETDNKQVKDRSVDQRLVALGKQLGGRVVTNDFNLNKVAGVHGVDVVNLNDVANALKPRYLPGEHVRLTILKEGESPGQGVGYLDDGTMVVCENAAHMIGKQIDGVVTSVLQSSAGRMIFCRLDGESDKKR